MTMRHQEAARYHVMLDRQPTYARREYRCDGCSDRIGIDELNMGACPREKHLCLPCWMIYVCRAMERIRREDEWRCVRESKRTLNEIRTMLRTYRHTPSANLP
jgi:hypothetical protein